MVAVLVSTMPNPNNHFDGINYLQMCILYLQYMRVSCVHRNLCTTMLNQKTSLCEYDTIRAVSRVKSSFNDGVLLQRFPLAPSVNDILVSWCLVETFSQTFWADCHSTASGTNYTSPLSSHTAHTRSKHAGGGGDQPRLCQIMFGILNIYFIFNILA